MSMELVKTQECVIYRDRCQMDGVSQKLDFDEFFKKIEAEFVRYLINYDVILASYAEIYDVASDVVAAWCKCGRVRGLDGLLHKHIIPRLRLYLVRDGEDSEDVLYLHLPRYLAERDPDKTNTKYATSKKALLRRTFTHIRFVVDKWIHHVADSDDLELFGGDLKIVSRVKWGLLEEFIAAVLYDAYSLENEFYDKTPKDWYFGILAEAYEADEVREFLRSDGAYVAFKFGNVWVLKHKYKCKSPLGYCYSYRRTEVEDPESGA